MNNRFLLFAGDTYYPAGGAEDFRGSFATLVEARNAAPSINNRSFDWWHVFDTETNKIVSSNYAEQEKI